jgi:ATP-binding cassette subfamily A (ABC1) protein 3
MHRLVGYCPQTNCIDSSLTVKSTLTFFAEIAGIVPDQIDRAVESLIKKIGLSSHESTAAGQLSGGNKRKLCLAMALIGRPKIVYIDEASAGVDPGARRAMWKSIRSEGANSAVVITTHAMEEAEALATKLGIMVQGKIKCFGTPNHIREKFGQGYEIEMNLDTQDMIAQLPDIPENEQLTNDPELIKQRLNEWREALRNLDFPVPIKFEDEWARYGLLYNFFTAVRKEEKVKLKSIQREIVLQNLVGAICDDITKNASTATVKQLDGAYVRIKLIKNDKSYGHMYSLLESMKKRFSIKEYQIKKSSLEQVFNSFATEEGYAILNRRLTLSGSIVTN